MSEHSQFRLLGSKRFLPFFTSQLLGAFNDNLFKQALILAILFKLSFNADRDLLINLSALLFILPFFLFSALGGQFGEKFDKDVLIRRIKLGEVAIMLLGALGLWLGSLPLLLVCCLRWAPSRRYSGRSSIRSCRRRWQRTSWLAAMRWLRWVPFWRFWAAPCVRVS